MFSYGQMAGNEWVVNEPTPVRGGGLTSCSPTINLSNERVYIRNIFSYYVKDIA